MYELIKVSEQCYYIESPSKVGIYRQNETDVYLIDSGSDKGSAKKTLKICSEQGWSIKGIINTHAHADHIGGNAYIQEQTGCDIFCSTVDIPFVEHTIINPLHIYGGYYPTELTHKFFLAKNSKAKDISSPEFPSELVTYDISGHSLGMIAIVAPDSTAFVGDIVSSELIIQKYGITYLLDIKKHLESLEFVENMNAKKFVMSHVDIVDDIRPLIALNRAKIYEIESKIIELCKEPMSFEHLLKELFEHYNLSMNIRQHALVGSTVRSYLSYLKNEGKVDAKAVDNIILWQTK